jgi:hypothetical protein
MDLQSSREAECDPDHYSTIAEHRERISVKKYEVQHFDMK